MKEWCGCLSKAADDSSTQREKQSQMWSEEAGSHRRLPCVCLYGLPWSLAMISTLPARITPTQLYVVPKSIPMAGDFSDMLLRESAQMHTKDQGMSRAERTERSKTRAQVSERLSEFRESEMLRRKPRCERVVRANELRNAGWLRGERERAEASRSLCGSQRAEIRLSSNLKAAENTPTRGIPFPTFTHTNRPTSPLPTAVSTVDY